MTAERVSAQVRAPFPRSGLTRIRWSRYVTADRMPRASRTTAVILVTTVLKRGVLSIRSAPPIRPVQTSSHTAIRSAWAVANARIWPVKGRCGVMNWGIRVR